MERLASYKHVEEEETAWLPSSDFLQPPDTILRWDVPVSTAPISSQSLLAVQLANICACVLIKHRTWTLYMSWHQDTSCECFTPCEADPCSHLQFGYIPLMLDWIGIWGVSRPGMTIWGLCPVPQMVFVIWWGKLLCQAGFVWLL